MKFCPKCGWQMGDDENYCRNCGTKVDGIANNGTANFGSHFDEVPARRINKTMAVIIKIFLIFAIVGVVFSAFETLFTGLAITDLESLEEIIGGGFTDFAESGFDVAQFVKIMQIVYIVASVFCLIPLIWILPMRKKIVKAINEGTTLTTGFKICTLLFVNLVVGILLLCSSEI